MTKYVVVRLIIGAFVLGLGVYTCSVTTPWLFDPYSTIPMDTAINRVILLFVGWIAVVYGLGCLYFAVREMERKHD